MRGPNLRVHLLANPGERAVGRRKREEECGAGMLGATPWPPSPGLAAFRAWWEKYFPTATCEVLTAQDTLYYKTLTIAAGGRQFVPALGSFPALV